MTLKTNFSKAIRGVGDPPCVVYSCIHKERCATQNMACSSFRIYVNTGKVGPNPNAPSNNPTAGLFKALFDQSAKLDD